MTMTLTEEDGTVTTWAPVTYSGTADTDWVPVSVNEPGQVESTTYGRDATGRVTRIVAAVPPNGATPPAPAVTCPTSGTLVGASYRGCRALDITYATATTATADLTAWTRLLGCHGDATTLAACEPKALRYRFLHVPARLTHSARRRRLRIPQS